MNNELAKYILREIRSLWRYDSILAGIEKDLKDISDEIESILSPTCPNGQTGPKIEHSGITKQTIINSLLSDEMDLLERQKKFERLKHEADKYRVKFLVAAEDDEEDFAKMVVEGVSYAKINHKFSYSNAFDHAIRICKRLKL